MGLHVVAQKTASKRTAAIPHHLCMTAELPMITATPRHFSLPIPLDTNMSCHVESVFLRRFGADARASPSCQAAV